jgi:hypothetical protein
MDIVDKTNRGSSMPLHHIISELLNDQELCAQHGTEYGLMTAMEKKQFKDYTKQQAKVHTAKLTDNQKDILHKTTLSKKVSSLKVRSLLKRRNISNKAHGTTLWVIEGVYNKLIAEISETNKTLIAELNEAYQAELQDINNGYKAIHEDFMRRIHDA